MKVERPQQFEVIQRIRTHADVPVRLTGVEGTSVTLAVENLFGEIVARGRFAAKKGVVEAVLKEVPEGGWYGLSWRGKVLATFGVGDVFVITGQSNAAGHGDGFIADRTGIVAVLGMTGNWRMAESGEDMPAGMSVGSPWVTMAELLALSDGVPVGIVNVAVGGTSTEQWRPDAADDSLYQGLKNALAARRVRAVLWHQGESDAIGGVKSERTFENMQALINQSRADAGWHVPWYVALASYVAGMAPETMEPTRAAQRLVHLHALAMPGPDTDTYVPPSMRHDGTHFGEVGLRVHGMLWFLALQFPR